MALLPLFLVLKVGWVSANAVGHTHTTCEGAVCRALVANSEAIMVRTLILEKVQMVFAGDEERDRMLHPSAL